MIVDVLPVPGGPCSNLSHLTSIRTEGRAFEMRRGHMCGNVFFAIILSIIRMMSLPSPVAKVRTASQTTLKMGRLVRHQLIQR